MTKQPTLPIPISAIQNSYLIFDAQAVSWLRRTHSICGSFIGTLHQNPSQNVFLALPLEIMPEEAQYLVEQGIAYILDDARAHDELMHESSREVREMQIARLREQGVRIAETKSKEREEVSRRMKDLRMGKGKKGKQVVASPIDCEAKVEQDSTPKPEVSEESASFFDDPPPAASIASLTSSTTTIVPTPTQTEYTITPSNSFDVLSPTSHAHPSSSPHTSYPGTTTALRALTTHLHSSATTKYFLHPGLRFGAHYSVYPGDPLRYHSHFLARAVDWDEKIDLMDLVAGGRLGTGVKKGYLLGGKEPPDEVNGDGRMRTFSIEWAAM